jgi:hypothetical protein
MQSILRFGQVVSFAFGAISLVWMIGSGFLAVLQSSLTGSAE